MKMLTRALPRAVFIFPLVLFCFLSLALASKSVPDSKQYSSTKASDRVITIRLVMSDNREILVSEYDGEMLTTGPREGDKLGITPRILDDGTVALDFSRVTKTIKKGVVVGGSTTAIGSMELNSALPQATPINSIYSIQLIGVSNKMDASGVRIQNKEECPCCITCNGQECCGLSVQMSCGSCCI